MSTWAPVRLLEQCRSLSRDRRSAWSAGQLASSAVAGRAAAFLAAPILARLYDDNDFAVLAVYSTMLALLSAGATFKLDWLIPSAGTDEEAVHISFLALSSALIVAGLAIGGLAVGGSAVATASGVPDAERWLWLLPLALLVNASHQIAVGLATRTRSYRQLAASSLAGSLLQSAVQVGLGLRQLGAGGLVAGNLLMQIGALTLLRPSKSAHRHFPQIGKAFHYGKRLCRERWRFALLSTQSSILSVGAMNAATLLVASLYGPSEAGQFFFATRVVRLPVTMLSESLGRVYFGESARIARELPGELPRILRRTRRALFLTGVGPAIGLLLWSPTIFESLFGSEWRLAGKFAQVMSLPLLGQFVVGPLTSTLRTVGRPGLQLTLDVLRLVATGAILATSNAMGLTAIQAIFWYAIGLALFYLVAAHSYLRAAQRFASSSS